MGTKEKPHSATALQRFAERQRDSGRFSRVVKRQRWRPILEHAIDEVLGLAQESLLEALVEGRRALVAHAVRVGDVDTVKPRVMADGEPALGPEDLGERLMAVRHGARSVEAGHLAVGEFARGHSVVDIAKFAQPLVDRHYAGREDT